MTLSVYTHEKEEPPLRTISPLRAAIADGTFAPGITTPSISTLTL